MDVPAGLVTHLRHSLGAWPPTAPLVVASSPLRTQPGWDGREQAMDGVVSPDGAVVSVPEHAVAALAAVADLDALDAALGDAIGRPGVRLGSGVFRWSDRPADLPDAGEWVPVTDRRVPAWLKPFGGDALVVLDGDRYVAGVGLKRHDQWSWELSVGTEPEARGRGLARRLVATATRAVLDLGAVPTYRHADDNVASAAVADAAGFPDRGWRALWLQRPPS